MSKRAYLLVHPETFPSNEAYNFPAGFEFDGDVDRLYGEVLGIEAARCERRMVILDRLAAEEFDDGFLEYFQVGVDPDGWEIIVAEPGELATVPIAGLDELGHVTVAGFNRYDCVRRLCDRLRSAGVQVSLHEPCTLPLTDPAAVQLLGHAT